MECDDVIEHLTPNKCYIGQRVYWVMWCDEPVGDDGKMACWYGYRPGLTPDVFSDTVGRIVRNAIMLREHGKAYQCYSNQIEAIHVAYETFVRWDLCHQFDRTKLGEASRVLRLLAELEYGLHCATNLADRMKA